MASFTFNGVKKDFIFILMGFNRPSWAPIERELLRVPSKAGGYLARTNVQERVIEVPVILKVGNQADLQKRKEELADWLITDEPKELIFDDEPDRTYMAVVNGEAELDELLWRGKGKLTFICPMPYKLGATQEHTLSIQNGSLRTTFTNKGTVESKPVIDIVIGNQSPYLDVWNDDEYFRLGYPTGVKTRVEKEYDRLVWDECTNESLPLWTLITGTIGSYTSAGSMKVWQKYAWTPNSYGTGSEWHGPMVKKTIPNPGGPIQDFRFDVIMTLEASNWNQMGKVVALLLDANDNIIVELNVADEYMSHELTNTYGIIDAGGPNKKWIRDEVGSSSIVFNQFRGHLAVARRGKEWSFYFAKYRKNTEIDDARFGRTWTDSTDSNPMTARPVAKIAVGVVAYGTEPPINVAFVEDIKFWKINTLTIDETPYIFDVGDKVQIDTDRSLATINGKSAIDLKDIFSKYPIVKRGANDIIVRPSNIGTAKLTYRERYK